MFIKKIKSPHIITGCATQLLFRSFSFNWVILFAPGPTLALDWRRGVGGGVRDGCGGEGGSTVTWPTALGSHQTQKGEMCRVQREPLRVHLTLCIAFVPQGPPSPPPRTPPFWPGPPDPGPLLFRGVWPGPHGAGGGRGTGEEGRGSGGGQWDLDGQWASEGWQRVCSRDERETAGRPGRSGLFPFHPRARSQSFRTWRMRGAGGEGGRSQEKRGRRAEGEGKGCGRQRMWGLGTPIGQRQTENCENLVAKFWQEL